MAQAVSALNPVSQSCSTRVTHETKKVTQPCPVASFSMATPLQLMFAIIAVLVALVGVIMQKDALHYAELGEVPDIGGGAFLGGISDGPFETAKHFYIDLRAHYRRASASLSMMANFVMLTSVFAGALSGFTSDPLIAGTDGLLLLIAASVLMKYAMPRRQRLRKGEQELEVRRVTYNETNFEGISKTMGLEVAQGGFRPIAPFERIRW